VAGRATRSCRDQGFGRDQHHFGVSTRKLVSGGPTSSPRLKLSSRNRPTHAVLPGDYSLLGGADTLARGIEWPRGWMHPNGVSTSRVWGTVIDTPERAR